MESPFFRFKWYRPISILELDANIPSPSQLLQWRSNPQPTATLNVFPHHSHYLLNFTFSSNSSNRQTLLAHHSQSKTLDQTWQVCGRTRWGRAYSRLHIRSRSLLSLKCKEWSTFPNCRRSRTSPISLTCSNSGFTTDFFAWWWLFNVKLGFFFVQSWQ